MTNPPILEAKGIKAGYDRGPDILDGANLTVSPGQILCIIGPNGAGKSTLLKTIAGLIKAREGTILRDGKPIEGLRPDQVIKHGICLVPQERALFPTMTVRENLRMGGYALENQSVIDELMNNTPNLFICGHSHILKVMHDKKLGLLHMNPGAAGDSGIHKVKTMLKFMIEGKDIRNLEVVELKRSTI